MRIEGASQQSTSYTKPETEMVQVTKKENSYASEKSNSQEIISHVKQNLGYQPTIQEKLIMESIETANKKILGPEREFEFAIHKETKQIMVKILDKSTKEIIREIPPEKVLDAVAHMWELAGLFMDERR